MEDLYSLLGVPRDASAEAIKKAYLQKARIEHPDKNPGDAGAHERFQALGRAYSVLRDAEKRSAYDAAGIVDDGPSTIGEAQWAAFWNDFYTRVTQDRIDAFAAGYRGSEEEAADLRCAYEDAKGDMGGILDRMMCSTEADEPRFREMLQADVAAGKVAVSKPLRARPRPKSRSGSSAQPMKLPRPRSSPRSSGCAARATAKTGSSQRSSPARDSVKRRCSPR